MGIWTHCWPQTHTAWSAWETSKKSVPGSDRKFCCTSPNAAEQNWNFILASYLLRTQNNSILLPLYLGLRIAQRRHSVRLNEVLVFFWCSVGPPLLLAPSHPHLFISLPRRSSDIHKHLESNSRLGRYGCRTALPDVRRYRRVKDSCSIIDRRIARGAEDFSIFSSSALQNNMLPHCSFMMSYVSEVCKVFFFFFFCKGSAWIRAAPGTEDVITFFSRSVQLGSVMCLLL